MANADRPERPFRLDIQGLRALAVLSVLLYHANAAVLPGGFVGVDVFFVISGFLITQILLAEIDAGKFSILRFYERRVRRLFPALYVMLVSVLLAGALFLSPQDYRELSHTALATVFFVSNIDFVLISGYFDGAAELKPLLHTWSLAVEEQFYIVFPIALALISAWSRKLLWPAMLLAAFASLALCLWVMRDHPSAAFYLAPFRAFELLIGAMLARAAPPARMSQAVRDGLSLAGLALILGSIVFISDDMAFPGLLALPPCLGAALVIYAGANGASLGGRLISAPFFTYYGNLSYSLYLWHWPVFVFALHYLTRAPTIAESCALVLVSIVLATLSWRYVEMPVLRRRTTPIAALSIGGATMAAGAACTLMIFVAGGFPQRFDARASAVFASADDYNPWRENCHAEKMTAYDKRCVFGARGAAPNTAIWADSHGAELVVALGERLKPRGESVLQLTASGCPPALGYEPPNRAYCVAYNDAVLRDLSHDARIDTVIFAADYRVYPNEDAVVTGMQRAIQGMEAAGKHAILVYPIPTFERDPPNILGMIAMHGGDMRDYAVTRAEFNAENKPIIADLDRARTATGALAFKPDRVLCDAASCPAYSENAGVLYFNRRHLSIAGARLLAQRFPIDALASR